MTTISDINGTNRAEIRDKCKDWHEQQQLCAECGSAIGTEAFYKQTGDGDGYRAHFRCFVNAQQKKEGAR